MADLARPAQLIFGRMTMKLVSSLALATTLTLGASILASAPAAAAPKKEEAPKATFSDAERKALTPLQTAVQAKNWEAAKAALPAAQAAAQGPDAKMVLGQFMLNIGVETKDETLQAQAIDTMIDSGKIAAADLPRYYQNQAIFATKAKDYAKAEAAFGKVLEANPNDANTVLNLAQLKLEQKKNAEALPLLERNIQLLEAAGQKPQEIVYKYALQLNLDGKNDARSLALSRQLLAAYPNAANWKIALDVFQRAPGLDRAAELDLHRLMRASKSLNQGAQYLGLAQELDTAGLPGEAKAVLDEAVASGRLTTKDPGYIELMRTIGPRFAGDRSSLAGEESRAMSGATGSLALKLGDAYASYGDYAKAITLYRAALGKGGVDANVVNTRLGIALAKSGDKAGAEAAFKTVTGPRAGLAGLWVAWLNSAA
jgi:tetratricopeptide (TPR) repeat protein